MKTHIDLNADLGEGEGDDDAMLALVTSANVACGGHAGDAKTMMTALAGAKLRGVAVGAHPGFEDPNGFGRNVVPMSSAEIVRMVRTQVSRLIDIADSEGIAVRYVKPHGALATLAGHDPEVARAVTEGVGLTAPSLAVLAISGTEMERIAREIGLVVFSEIFADRGYLADGQLVPRGCPGALIHDAKEAADRVLEFLETDKMPTSDGGFVSLDAHSICVHGDNPEAVQIALEVRTRLTEVGVQLATFLD